MVYTKLSNLNAVHIQKLKSRANINSMRTIWKKYFNLLSATAIHFRAIFPFYIYEFNMLQSVRCDDDDGTRSKSKWSRSLESTHTAHR